MIRPLLPVAMFACIALPALAQTGRQADADDCAVYAAALAGKSFEMFADRFGANCDWKASGMNVKIVPPPEGKYFDGVRTSLTQPSYTDNGQRASFQETDGGQRSASSYFYQGFICTAERRDGRWHSTGCRMQFIT